MESAQKNNQTLRALEKEIREVQFLRSNIFFNNMWKTFIWWCHYVHHWQWIKGFKGYTHIKI